MKRQLYVTADDFGSNHRNNVAIDYAIRNNIVTQASLMVTSVCTEEAVEMAKRGGVRRSYMPSFKHNIRFAPF